MTPTSVLRLAPADNVLLARDDLARGAALPDGGTTQELVPRGHKVAAADIAAGAPIRRYG